MVQLVQFAHIYQSPSLPRPILTLDYHPQNYPQQRQIVTAPKCTPITPNSSDTIKSIGKDTIGPYKIRKSTNCPYTIGEDTIGQIQ